MDFRLQSTSPYCINYKIPNQQKGLIMQHLIVRKLTRRELEDKYLRLIDDNFELKRENNMQKEKIKVLTTKLLRLTKENNRYKSNQFLFMDEANEITELEDYFRSQRPASSSVLSRKLTDEMRNSTPNLSRLKSDISLLESAKGNHSNNNNISGKSVAVVESENSNAVMKNMDDTSSKLKEMHEEIQKLQRELKDLHDIEELERQTNIQLEQKVNELTQKLSSTDIQKELEINVKIKELQVKLSDLAEEYKKKMEENKIERDKLNEMLDKEKCRILRYEAQSHDFESSQKMIDDLMKQVAALEKEKLEVVKQYEKYSSYSDEIAKYQKQINEMSEIIEMKQKELENERADKESVQHSQEELLRKMKQLQQDNDELVVKLEGLKSENDSLLTKNKKLESRIKILEDQNKKYLKQVNETLSMPTPIQKDRETMIANSLKDVKKLEEFNEQHNAALAISPPRSYSSSPPNLSIPSVKVLDERRPSTSEKELKIIPKIIEPLSNPHKDVTADEVSTIPRDSSAATMSQMKNFAEVFSQSVSKDTPIHSGEDDDFDPKTFSIDQTSSHMQMSLEHAKELLKDEMKQRSIIKHVRLSLDQSSHDNESKKFPLMNLRKVIENSSRNSTSSSITSNKSLTTIPKFILENLNDEKLVLKHAIHKIDIEIISLELCEESSLLNSEIGNFIYIEFSFLNHIGHLLETQSLAKPKRAGNQDCTFYNFKRAFEIRPSENRQQFKLLKSMLAKKSKNHLKFLLVSEPICGDNVDDDDAGDCEEIGFGIAKMCELVDEATNDVIIKKIECFSTEYPHELIAYLNIRISGASVMKKLRDLK